MKGLPQLTALDEVVVVICTSTLRVLDGITLVRTLAPISGEELTAEIW